MAIISYAYVENEAARNDVISLYNWWIEKGKPNSFSLQADFSILYPMHISFIVHLMCGLSGV